MFSLEFYVSFDIQVKTTASHETLERSLCGHALTLENNTKRGGSECVCLCMLLYSHRCDKWTFVIAWPCSVHDEHFYEWHSVDHSWVFFFSLCILSYCITMSSNLLGLGAWYEIKWQKVKSQRVAVVNMCRWEERRREEMSKKSKEKAKGQSKEQCDCVVASLADETRSGASKGRLVTHKLNVCSGGKRWKNK